MYKAFHGRIWDLFKKKKKKVCLKTHHEHLQFIGHYWFKHASYVHKDRCSNFSSWPSLHSIMHIWLHGLKKNCAFSSNFGYMLLHALHPTETQHLKLLMGRRVTRPIWLLFLAPYLRTPYPGPFNVACSNKVYFASLSHIQNSHKKYAHTLPSVYDHSPF